MYLSIQACRAIAALLVVFFHLGGLVSAEKYSGFSAFRRWFWFGDSGVFFFFVLSGFIISHVHSGDVGQPAKLGHYIGKRLARIYPVYWVVYLSVYALASLSGDTRANLPHDLPTIIRSLLLVPQDTSLVGSLGAPVLVVAWTLQYELVFYLIFGSFIANQTLGWGAIVAVAGAAVPCMLAACAFPLSFAGNSVLALFCLGVMMSLLCDYIENFRWPVLAAFLGILSFAVLAAIDIAKNDPTRDYAGRTLLYGVASSAVILGLVKSEGQNGGMLSSSNSLVLLGDASYSLYLIHYPLISALCKIAALTGAFHSVVGTWFSFVLIAILCIAASIMFSYFVERPLVRLGKIFRAGASSEST